MLVQDGFVFLDIFTRLEYSPFINGFNTLKAKISAYFCPALLHTCRCSLISDIENLSATLLRAERGPDGELRNHIRGSLVEKRLVCIKGSRKRNFGTLSFY